ncbi:choice-of-anchor I family protein [Pontibacter silvestris]|uniref:Choice-of-anchor I family protein n=1 Tax=Pontibacter silvestris TaxID=2305183 RepID=A0ABW4WUD0_9BACT|nr:choice-of-anchor I family protein [Pontibacter silvestris]MCC9137977.1 choice-of-anchor I family protein [Pontibacter silvestris]
MNKKLLFFGLGFILTMSACREDEDVTVPFPTEDPAGFSEIGEIHLEGGAGAAEISAYDPSTKRLFVVNNAVNSRVDVIDVQNPATPEFIQSIDITPYGGGVNSVAVKNGILAAAVEANIKQDNGKVALFNTKTYDLLKLVPVGALPDMVTFSPDGTYILSANEGEPNSDYTVDPNGSVSIISAIDNYNVVTLEFTAFNNSQADLEAKGLRVFGPNATLAMDVEPEYITVSEDSKTAWVTLQENNAIAKIDLETKSVTSVVPLGFKDHSLNGNEFDVSDEDNAVAFATWPVKGIYLPDALASFSVNGTDYIITANEGDAREYNAFEEEARVKKLPLDSNAFPNAAELQKDLNLGRLKVTTTLGDIDSDGDYDELYSFGTRSFSIWQGATGVQVYDSGNEIEKKLAEAIVYPDDRSDDKGAEPEGVTVGVVNNQTIAFIGSERADAVLLYDVTNPNQPQFLQVLKTGDAPEGIIFIAAAESPNKKSLLIVSSEDDGVVKVFEAGKI